MNQTPRYATLQDYLRVIRQRRLLIVAVVVIFAGVGFGISKLQTSTYQATASLQFRDIAQDFSLLGPTAAPTTSPDQRASANAELINRTPLMVRVKRVLRTPLSVPQLQGAVSAQVGARSNLVLVTAASDNAQFAAALANAVAREAQKVEQVNQAARIDIAITNLRKQVAGARKQGLPSNLRFQNLSAELSQLETAKEIIRPVEIGQFAEVPTTPVSPRPIRNAILGGLVGIAIGLMAAFLRDVLDRRLRQSREVQEELDLPVLGRVSEEALGFAGLASNGRAALADSDLESFRILRTNLDFLSADNPMRMVLVTSGLPEEGKSTVAASLASAAVVAGKRTLLVECDLRRPSLAARLGIKQTPGLTDYLVGHATPQEILQTVKIAEQPGVNGSIGREADSTRGSLVCIAAGETAPHPAELLGSQRCREFLEKVSRAYDFVVLDTSPLLSVVDALNVVPHVDGVVVCVRLMRTTRDEAHAAKAALEHLPERPTGVVITGISPEDDTYGYYYHAYGAS